MQVNLLGAFGNFWGAEHHVRAALEELGHEVRAFDYRKGEGHKAVGVSADLTLVLKGEGIPPHIIEQFCKPTVLWYGELIHQRPVIADEVSIQKVKELAYNVAAFDFVFHHDYTALETVKSLGARRVFWMPNSGVNPSFHRKLNIPKVYDVGFSGTLSPRRIEMLNYLDVQGVQVVFAQVYGEDFNLFINKCKIFINLHFTELLNTETRLHEILGAGTFALTEEISMTDMYVDGKHLVYWKLHDFEDLYTKIKYYLKNESEREKIAFKGYKLVHFKYKYTDRCNQLLNIVFSHINS